MKRAGIIVAVAALWVATPAFATETIICTSTISPTDGPQLWLVVGSGPGVGIVQARLQQGSQDITAGHEQAAPVISQSWLDRNSLRLSLADANAEREIVRLEAWRRSGGSYFGTMRYGGRTWRVRCTGDD
jgi:hypothetical protein